MKAKKPRSKGVLTPTQREILQVFREILDAHRFYLTGGTALAGFYLGHRRSFDLDLFTPEAGLVLPFWRGAEERWHQSFAVKVIRRLETFAEFEMTWQGESVRVRLAYDTPYRFAPPVATPLTYVNDYRDLVVDELLAFFGRTEPRAAVDLFFILRNGSLLGTDHPCREERSRV